MAIVSFLTFTKTKMLTQVLHKTDLESVYYYSAQGIVTLHASGAFNGGAELVYSRTEYWAREKGSSQFTCLFIISTDHQAC